MSTGRNFRFRQKKSLVWTRLKVKYFKLKIRSKERTGERRRLKERIRRLEHRNEQLTQQCQSYRLGLEPQLVFNHHYPAQMMALAVFIVLQGGSLRCAAATASFYAQLMGWEQRFKHPCASTIRNWVCRCGLHALKYSKNLSGQYVAILDESIQIGKEKLLLMLGVPIHPNQCYSAALTSKDVVVLGLEVQNSWKGKDIARFINHHLAKCSKLSIQYLISDQGNSIRAAVKQLEIKWVSDCTHVMMNAVKKLFIHDQALSTFCAQVGQLRKKLILSDFATLLPPTLRDKDRFLKLFLLLEWTQRMDQWWPDLCPKAQEHLRFYRQAWHLLNRMRQVRYLIILASSILKTAGLSSHSYQRWQKGVEDFYQSTKIITQQAKDFIGIIDKYFIDHACKYQGMDQLLCCSDIIESTFGRYKNKGTMKVISTDVLTIALYNQSVDINFIQQAMNHTSCEQLERWQNQYVCQNRYGLIQQKKRELKSVG